jgi:GT2 family glycosyltransferase
MISIVMSFYNRKALLDRTLEWLHKSEIKDYELIIVDDASPEPLVCPEATVVRIERKDKWWHNPCIPFNMGFKKAKGDIILIQNPECMHQGDILKYVTETIQPKLYLSFACYAINEVQTKQLSLGVMPDIEDKSFGGKERNGYYNHSVFRPVGYHFCSAIMKSDLDKIGGFDEKYANGISFDDDDLAYKISASGIRIKLVDRPFVIHQWHVPFTYKQDGWRLWHERNKAIFESKWG